MKLQGGIPEIDHALADSRGIASHDAEHSDLDRRGARIEGKQEWGTTHDRTRSRWVRSATSLASATEARRTRRLSARLVRMIGMRAPSTRPAASAPAKYINCFASMLPDSRSGTSRMSACPATGELMPLIFAATTLI